MAQRKCVELIDQFGDEDLAQWPFWAAGEGYFSRGRAYATIGDTTKAADDFNAALDLIRDKRLRADILAALGRKVDDK